MEFKIMYLNMYNKEMTLYEYLKITPNHIDNLVSSPVVYSLDLIGLFGPVILGTISLWQLWDYGIYWYIYIITFLANSLINKVLKTWVREPRPRDGKSMIDTEQYSGIEKYGMPSGHSQSVFCTMVYSYLVKQSPMLLIGEMYIASLTVYQRWKYRRHTISQLYMGAIIGCLVAYLSYYITMMYVTGQI